MSRRLVSVLDNLSSPDAGDRRSARIDGMLVGRQLKRIGRNIGKASCAHLEALGLQVYTGEEDDELGFRLDTDLRIGIGSSAFPGGSISCAVNGRNKQVFTVTTRNPSGTNSGINYSYPPPRKNPAPVPPEVGQLVERVDRHLRSASGITAIATENA